MNFRLKRIVFSTILFAASAVHTSSYAQATREEIFDNIAVTGGVYYAYPAPGVQTKAPKGYEPFYISHFGRHGSRWLISDEEYIRVMEVFEKAHQAGKLTPLGEDVRKRLAIVWADAEGRDVGMCYTRNTLRTQYGCLLRTSEGIQSPTED